MIPYILALIFVAIFIGVIVAIINDYKILEKPYRVVMNAEGTYFVQVYREIHTGNYNDMGKEKIDYKWESFYETKDESDAIIHYKMALKAFNEEKNQKELEAKKKNLEKEIEEQKKKIVKTLKIKD